MMVDKLSEYGYSFQVKLIAALLGDRAYLPQILEILHDDYFESEANQEIVKIIREYFTQYRQIPTLEVFKIKMASIDSDVLKTAMIEHLKDVWRNLESTDLDMVKEEALTFCKNQNLKAAILESVEKLESRDYDGIKQVIDTAMRAGAEQRIGHDYLIDVKSRYAEAARQCVETRWPIINEIMDGGLSRGELGVILGAAGSGKSWLLQSLAAHALQKGLIVVYYTLELDEAYVGRRFDALLTGIPFQNLKFHQDEVAERLGYIEKGQLFINYFPEYSITVTGIRTHIEKYIMRGIKPDLIVLDYADCLKPIMLGKRERSDQIAGDVYSMLKGIAGELQLPIFTASQVNRSGASADIIQGHDVADSYIKIMKADFIMSLSRKVEDKIAGTGRIHIIKNRFGPDGITFPSKINFSTGHIEIHEGATVEGKETQKMMDGKNEYARKYLANKFKEMKDDGSQNQQN